MKTTNFCAIFATVFVAATVIMLASCSQDDEYYEDGLFTRADEMMTRAGEPGGYTPTPPTPPPYFGNPVKAGGDTIGINIEGYNLETYIYWTKGFTGMSTPRSSIHVVAGFYPILPPNDSLISLISTTGEWFGYNNQIKLRIRYRKDSTYYKYPKDTTVTFVRDFYHLHTASCESAPELLLE